MVIHMVSFTREREREREKPTEFFFYLTLALETKGFPRTSIHRSHRANLPLGYKRTTIATRHSAMATTSSVGKGRIYRVLIHLMSLLMRKVRRKLSVNAYLLFCFSSLLTPRGQVELTYSTDTHPKKTIPQSLYHATVDPFPDALHCHLGAVMAGGDDP